MASDSYILDCSTMISTPSTPHSGPPSRNEVAPDDDPNAHVHLANILSVDKIRGALFTFVSPATLIRLSRTCRDMQAIVSSYAVEAFDIDCHLSQFFLDPSNFRSLQARTGTLVSGSSALQFFDRSCYVGSDLDLYTPGDSCKVMGDYLLAIGYTFVPHQWQNTTFTGAIVNMKRSRDKNRIPRRHPKNSFAGRAKDNSREYHDRAPHPIDGHHITTEATHPPRPKNRSFEDILAVFTFLKQDPLDASEKAQLKIQIIATVGNPMEVIFNFHSSKYCLLLTTCMGPKSSSTPACVMNVITWKFAYCLYPKATLEDRRSLVCRSEGPKQVIAEQKYQSRGWDMVRTLRADGPLGEDPSFPSGLRFMGDKHSWRIALDITRVDLPPPIPGLQ